MAGIGSFFKALMGICETRPLGAELWSVEGGKAVVQKPESVPKGGATYLQGKGLEQPLLIVRTDDDRYLSFVNACTHGKRKLDPVAGERKLRCCSLLHSQFDYEGKPLSGPARKPLERKQVEQAGGRLEVTL